MIEHKDLYDLLKTLTIQISPTKTYQVPVAYDHFDSDKKVTIPFIIYRETSPETFRADGITYHQFYNYEIELITEKKETALERQIEQLLTNNKIPYSKNDEVWDSDEKIYHNFYEI